LNVTLAALNQTDALAITFPDLDDEQALRDIANGFRARSDEGAFADCIGAIDGWVPQILCPSLKDVPNPGRYYCRKGFYGINVQAICDADYRFRHISLMCPGSAHNTTAWKMSSLRNSMGRHGLLHPFYFIGDAAYRGEGGILVPHGASHNGEGDTWKDSFDFHLSQCRITIEQCFGMLTRRWRILCSPLASDFEHNTQIIRVCMKLHNFCMDRNGVDDLCARGQLPDRTEEDIRLHPNVVNPRGQPQNDVGGPRGHLNVMAREGRAPRLSEMQRNGPVAMQQSLDANSRTRLITASLEMTQQRRPRRSRSRTVLPDGVSPEGVSLLDQRPPAVELESGDDSDVLGSGNDGVTDESDSGSDSEGMDN
jgi:hypothetical protein